MFIKLTQLNGRAIVINTAHVIYVEDGGEEFETRIILMDDNALDVKEDYSDVAAKLIAASRP